MANRNPYNLAICDKLASLRGGPFVDKLYWLALQHESDDLKEFLDEIVNSSRYVKKLQKLFPELDKDVKNLKAIDNGEMLHEVLLNTKRLGFLAEVHHPECSDFGFKKDGSVGRFSVSGFMCRIEHVYADSIEELIEKLVVKCNEIFQGYVDDFKKGEGVAMDKLQRPPGGYKSWYAYLQFVLREQFVQEFDESLFGDSLTVNLTDAEGKTLSTTLGALKLMAFQEIQDTEVVEKARTYLVDPMNTEAHMELARAIRKFE